MKASVFVGTRLDVSLKHIATQQYLSGLVKSEYEILTAAAE